MSDDRFDVVVHHSGEVEAHEEAAEVEIGDASGLNSDVEVEGEIEVEGGIHAGSTPSLDLVVEPYATQLSTI